MYVNYYSVDNQQKIVSGLVELNFETVAEWFAKFSDKENTIVKVELSSIDIEKVFQTSMFFKGELTSENNVTYEETYLGDLISFETFIPHWKVSNMQLNHPVLLKRKLDYDQLHNVIYCFKGTLKAINTLLQYNKLAWSTKANRTKEENYIIKRMKAHKTIDVATAKEALIDDEDYEIIDKIFDIETMELLLEDESVPFKDLLSKRLNEFTESQDMDSVTYIEDY